jgi:hypothetical protein
MASPSRSKSKIGPTNSIHITLRIIEKRNPNEKNFTVHFLHHIVNLKPSFGGLDLASPIKLVFIIHLKTVH